MTSTVFVIAISNDLGEEKDISLGWFIDVPAPGGISPEAGVFDIFIDVGYFRAMLGY